ncbi:hypothetical protein D3C76_655780 [compost metagenome]
MAEVIQFTEQFVTQAQHCLGPLQHDATSGRQVQLRTLALQQCNTQALLQLRNLFAHSRLADVQRLPRLGKATTTHHFDKTAQLFEFHDHYSSLEFIQV